MQYQDIEVFFKNVNVNKLEKENSYIPEGKQYF